MSGQLWAAAAAHHFGVAPVETYSGGTEVTAFHPNAVDAIARAGFRVERGSGDNPHYTVTFAHDAAPLECFSKTYDDPVNPQGGFAALMTCAEADKACPVVFGAELRVPLRYDDPKVSDGTGNEVTVYDTGRGAGGRRLSCRRVRRWRGTSSCLLARGCASGS